MLLEFVWTELMTRELFVSKNELEAAAGGSIVVFEFSGRLSPRKKLVLLKSHGERSKVGAVLLILPPASLGTSSMASERQVEVAPRLVRLSARKGILVLETSSKSGAPTSICSFLFKNGVALNLASDSGSGAPSGSPAREIVVEVKITIVAQKRIGRQRVLAPVGAELWGFVFILVLLFSLEWHTQTSFHEGRTC